MVYDIISFSHYIRRHGSITEYNAKKISRWALFLLIAEQLINLGKFLKQPIEHRESMLVFR